MIAAALLYRFSSIQGQISSEEIQARFPTFQATSFNGKIFDNEGLIKYAIKSDQVVYYQDKGLVEMINPEGSYFDHSDPIKTSIASSQQDAAYAIPFNFWKITADHGFMVHNKVAVLEGSVIASPSNAESEIQKITTPHMLYDMAENTISSESEIIIQGKRFIDQGRDYKLDLSAKTFVIQEKPHAVYYP